MVDMDTYLREVLDIDTGDLMEYEPACLFDLQRLFLVEDEQSE